MRARQTRGGKQFSVNDMLKEVSKDRTDQIGAQIAVLSCEVSADALRIGLQNTVLQFFIF